MSKTRDAIIMGIGILPGITLCSPTAQAAIAETTTLSDQPIYMGSQKMAHLC